MLTPFKFRDKSYVLKKVRRILRTDPVITTHQLENRLDFNPPEREIKPTAADWLGLLDSEGFVCIEHLVKTSVGARVKTPEQFVCASKRVAELTDWNLRQLAGLAALRYGLGIRSDNWQLRALERTNQSNVPIPDAMIHLSRATNPQVFQSDSYAFRGLRKVSKAKPSEVIAIEWDSGSATRTEMIGKIHSYAQVANYQIWVAPTTVRAKTITELLKDYLPIDASLVVAVDWRSADLLWLMLPHRGSSLEQFVSRVSNVDAPWSIALKSLH